VLSQCGECGREVRAVGRPGKDDAGSHGLRSVGESFAGRATSGLGQDWRGQDRLVRLRQARIGSAGLRRSTASPLAKGRFPMIVIASWLVRAQATRSGRLSLMGICRWVKTLDSNAASQASTVFTLAPRKGMP
jgi:hypothetical protein